MGKAVAGVRKTHKNTDPFDTATRRRSAEPGPDGLSRIPALGFLWRHRAHVFVCLAVVVVLVGAALYSSRFTERTPRVVYSFSLEEAEREAEAPLVVDINEADAEKLDELPQVGPATAEEIISHRRANGDFRTLDDLEEVPGIGPKTVEEIKPFATV
ncbi:Helix-hairpin-helix motif [Rubrobacter radiotolerans]|uniref:Helix-hairpin-helix domain-containing protein n=1 Tax=Rubrobacter radiotolerans TaxID=42256 RepID=A0A023X478_RUBRA|nr:helix-hairpin-helix domain-containing protein [Rubrobacter radiotolerans]AHY46810.1 Helix-hairpin-helix motif [Rubrobacter radiotolerans]MDX5894217.1 helix-hairpin-helix domain-containing protein [Rubrobacter radiotolerans]SMC05489.1 competence protein ComEA [Rubrobacter radiotolerans DSM 5868]